MSVPEYKLALIAARKSPSPPNLAALSAQIGKLVAAGEHVRAEVLGRALEALGGVKPAVPASAELQAWLASDALPHVAPPPPPPPTARDVWRAEQEAAKRAAEKLAAEAARPRLVAALCQRLIEEVGAMVGADGKIFLTLDAVETLEGASSPAEAAELLAWTSTFDAGASAGAKAELDAAKARLGGSPKPDTSAALAAASALVAAHAAERTEASREKALAAYQSLLALGAVGQAVQLKQQIESIVVVKNVEGGESDG